MLSCVKRGNVNLAREEVNETDSLRALSAEIASSLDDRLLAAQVFISGIDGKGQLPSHIKTLLADIPAGGIMLFRYNLDTDNDSIRALVTEAVSVITEEAGISPFIAVDHEGGNVNRFLRPTASLPAASSYWELYQSADKEQALSKILADSGMAGRELYELGINLNFAPVAECLTINNRVFLENRSYGPDAFFTAEAAAAFTRGMEQAGVLCVIKHFPGSSGPDPHYSASVISADKAELDALVYPFSFLINNGARAVMIAHTAVPAVDSRIASLSPSVMRDWLRGELMFGGLIISDDFAMAAAGELNREEAAVKSVAAGSDMVLVWPSDLKKTHGAFTAALEDGRLSRERLQDAAQRVIYEKLRIGLVKK